MSLVLVYDNENENDICFRKNKVLKHDGIRIVCYINFYMVEKASHFQFIVSPDISELPLDIKNKICDLLGFSDINEISNLDVFSVKENFPDLFIYSRQIFLGIDIKRCESYFDSLEKELKRFIKFINKEDFKLS